MRSLVLLTFIFYQVNAFAQVAKTKRAAFRAEFKASYFEEKTTVWLDDSKVDLHSSPSYAGSINLAAQIFGGLYFVGEGEYIGFSEPEPKDFTLIEPVKHVINYRASLMYDAIDLDIFNRIKWYFTFEKDHMIAYNVDEAAQTITKEEVDIYNGNIFVMLKSSSFSGVDHYVGLGATLYNHPDIEGDPEISYRKYMAKIRLVFGMKEQFGVDLDYNYISVEDQLGNKQTHQRVWVGLVLGFQ